MDDGIMTIEGKQKRLKKTESIFLTPIKTFKLHF